MNNYLDNLKNWPKNIKDSIKNKEILVISEDDAIKYIHGRDKQNMISFFVSNDVTNVGTLTITKGMYTDVEWHKGDEVIFLLKGNIQIKVWKGKLEDEKVFQKCYCLKEHDKFFIPEGYNHRYFNLNEETAKLLFNISPNL